MKEAEIPKITKVLENSESCLSPLLHESIFNIMSDYIPEDIQLKILKLLPIKSLMRFRCVCKWWKQTIDSQPFIEDHLARQKRCLIVECELAEYLVANPYKLPSFDILIAPTPERLRLVGTLHGVICFYNEIHYNFLLWNPIICRCITVKGGPSLNWDIYHKGEYMINPCCGFWIDPLTKDFKIIAFILFDNEDEDDECWVYSSIRGDWKELTFGFDLFHYTMEVAPAVVMDGVGYWIVYFDYEADNEEENNVGVAVMSFDFVKENFLEPVYALSLKRGWNLPVLCDKNGALSLLYIDPDFSSHIFVMKEDKWVLVDSLLILPIAKRCIWGMVDVEEKEKNKVTVEVEEKEKNKVMVEVEEKEKNYVMVLATTTSDDLLKFDNSDSKALGCTWTLLRSMIKESNVVVANGFVESLVFPQDAVAQRLDVASQPPIGDGAFSSKTDVDQTHLFLDIEGVNKKRLLYETNAYVNTAGGKGRPSSSHSQQVAEEVERLDGIQERFEQMNADFKVRMAELERAYYGLGTVINIYVNTVGSEALPSLSHSQQVDEKVERRVLVGIQEGLRQMNADFNARMAELKAELECVELAHERAELARAEHVAAEQRIEGLVLAELAKMTLDLLEGDDNDDSTTP